jgi:hypothetical protein
MSAPKYLVDRCVDYDPTHMQDFIQIMAMNVEDALLQMGAVPGVDYTLRDVIGWAMPFALHAFSEPNGGIGREFVCSK